MPSAPVFDIKRFALHDGPGIRTTVFLQGCPLRCRWCQNPEGLERDPPPWQDPGLCLDCQACQDACPALAIRREQRRRIVDAQRCRRCGACTRACPSTAMRPVARRMTVAEVMDQVLADALFHRQSAGGLTLSGGEPLRHPRFVAALLEGCRHHRVPVAIETSLAVPALALRALDGSRPLMLCDLKAPDAGRCAAWTGGDLGRILANLDRIVAAGLPLRIRIPVIPACTAEPEAMAAIRALARQHAPQAPIELMPYNPLPAGKYARLGRPWDFPRGHHDLATLVDPPAATLYSPATDHRMHGESD